MDTPKMSRCLHDACECLEFNRNQWKIEQCRTCYHSDKDHGIASSKSNVCMYMCSYIRLCVCIYMYVFI